MSIGNIFFAAAAAAIIGGVAAAHGPTPQQVSGSIQTSADPGAVWAILGNPGSYADWHPLVASVTMEGEGQGAKRTVKFVDGGTVVDGIDRIDNENMEIRWRLSEENIEAFPASYYTNSVKVAPSEGGSEISWKASLFRADTTNEPEERFSDSAAVEAIEALIQDGLSGLKDATEGGSS